MVGTVKISREFEDIEVIGRFELLEVAEDLQIVKEFKVVEELQVVREFTVAEKFKVDVDSEVFDNFEVIGESVWDGSFEVREDAKLIGGSETDEVAEFKLMLSRDFATAFCSKEFAKKSSDFFFPFCLGRLISPLELISFGYFTAKAVFIDFNNSYMGRSSALLQSVSLMPRPSVFVFADTFGSFGVFSSPPLTDTTEKSLTEMSDNSELDVDDLKLSFGTLSTFRTVRTSEPSEHPFTSL